MAPADKTPLVSSPPRVLVRNWRPALSDRREQTIRLATVSSMAGLLGKVLSVPAGVVVAYFLGPFQLGVLALVRLIQTYIGFTHLGLQSVLARNVPIAYGAGNREEARYTTNVVFTGVLVSLTAATAILWALYLGGVTYKGALTTPRMVLFTVMLLSARALAFLRDYSKAEGKLMTIVTTDVLLSSALPVLTVAGVALFAVEGALAAAAAANCVTLVYYLRLLEWPRFSLRFDLHKTAALLRTGVLIFINKVGDNAFWSADLIVIGVLMTPSDVGLYSLALTAVATVHPFLGGFNSVVYRRIMEETGEKGTEDRTHYRKYAGSPSFISYLMLNSLVLGLAAIGLSTVVRMALPEFADAPRLMRVLTLGYTIYGSMIFMRYYLDATGQLHRRVWMVIGALLANVVLDYAAVFLGFGLPGVAWACTFAFLVNAAVILVFCFGQIYGDWRYGVRFVLQLFAIALLCYAFLAVSSDWILWAHHGGDAAKRWLFAGADLAVKSAAFVIWCVGCYLAIFRDSHLLDEILPGLRYFWTWIRERAPLGEAAS